jgi:large subunit ribosomal protein L24
MKEYSRQPRKQRLANYNRNQHAQMRAMSAHLSDELLKEYSLVRSMTVRKGDTVKVVRGIFKGHTAKVVKAFPQKGFISIDEATLTKADGKKVARMFRPSNVILTKMDMSDPWRREKLSRFRTPGRPAAAEEEKPEKKEAAEEKKEPKEAQEKEEGDKMKKPERSEGEEAEDEGGAEVEEKGDKSEKPERSEGKEGKGGKLVKPERSEGKEGAR